MVEAFDILRVNANPARFDAKKCEAVNASHIRLLDPKELAEQLVPFLVRAGLVADPPTPASRSGWRRPRR
jgi:glutamyl-tRNA synthetase